MQGQRTDPPLSGLGEAPLGPVSDQNPKRVSRLYASRRHRTGNTQLALYRPPAAGVGYGKTEEGVLEKSFGMQCKTMNGAGANFANDSATGAAKREDEDDEYH
jgi:hypothetical protein